MGDEFALDFIHHIPVIRKPWSTLCTRRNVALSASCRLASAQTVAQRLGVRADLHVVCHSSLQARDFVHSFGCGARF